MGIAHSRAGLIHASDISTFPAYGISALNAQYTCGSIRGIAQIMVDFRLRFKSKKAYFSLVIYNLNFNFVHMNDFSLYFLITPLINAKNQNSP